MRSSVRLWFALVLLAGLPTHVYSQAGGSVFFNGIEVSPLGGATLSVIETRQSNAAEPAGSRLYVGNLSFNGSDGLSMHIGGGQGGQLKFPDLASSFPRGGEMEFHVADEAGIEPCIRVATSAAGGNVTLDPDFSILGASSYRAEIWNDGAPVVSIDGMSGVLTTAMLPMSFAVDLEGVIAPLPDPFPLPASSAFGLSDGFYFGWTADVAIMDAAGSMLGTGDELRFYPQSMMHLSSVFSIDVTVAVPVIYTMAVDDMALLAFGKCHRARKSCSLVMFDAENKPVSMTLLPGVLGGVQVDVHPSDSRDMLIWDYKDGFVTGDMDEFSVTAELLADGQGVVGKVTSLHDGSHWNVTPDFRGSGSPDARVELFDASGNLVAMEPNVRAFTIMTNEWATQTGVEDNESLALVLGFATPVPVDIGAGPVTASRIVMHSNASKKHKFFAIIDRTNLSEMGGDFLLIGEPNTSVLVQPPLEVDVESTGLATGKRQHGALLVSRMGAGGGDGVSIVPCLLPAQGPPDQFGIQWAPLGPPSAQMGETEWAFLTRHAGDVQPGPTQKMSILMSSGRATVSLKIAPGPPNAEFEIILKRGGRIVAQYTPPNPIAPFATLPDWPIAVGYQVLQYDDKPWSMWINLGYEMDVQPPDPVVRSARSSFPLTKADLIEVIAINRVNPGPPEMAVLQGKFTGIPFIVLLDDRPTPTFVGSTPRIARSVLHPARPNPFNPQTTLSFDLAEGGHVFLKVYAVDGSFVATVHEGVLRAGQHSYEWDGVDQRGRRLASGVYFAELRTPDGVQRTKLTLLK